MSRGHGRAVDPPDQIDDGELLRRVRAGDETAYGELWARHARTARRVAAGLVPAADVEDIVSEAFERTLAAIRGGNGPHTSFSSYVAQTMRARAATMYAGRSRVSLSENDDDLDRPVEDPDPFLGAPARDRVVRAFQELPPRWQDALWVSVVEAQPPRRVAARLGTSPNGVSALVIRARRRLRANFIDLSAAESRNPLCSKAIAAPHRHAEHLSSCDHCGATMEGLAELDVRLHARGAGLAAILAVCVGRARASQGWARNAFAAAPAKAVAAVVVVTTAGAALTPLVVHPPGHAAVSPARSSAAVAGSAPGRVATEAVVEHLSPSPVAPTWFNPPAAVRAAPTPAALRSSTVAPAHQAPAPATTTTSTTTTSTTAATTAATPAGAPTAAPAPGPDAPASTTGGYPGRAAPMAAVGSGARTPRRLSLEVRAVATCACARIRVQAAHRPDVVRVRTHQRGAVDQLVVLHPSQPGVLHLSVPSRSASRAPMAVTVTVTRRRTQRLEANVVVRRP